MRPRNRTNQLDERARDREILRLAGPAFLALVSEPLFLLADAAIVYSAEGRYGMVLKVEVAVDDLRSRSCDLLYRLSDVAAGTEVARARTGIRFYDYAARRVVSAPAPFREALGAATGLPGEGA